MTTTLEQPVVPRFRRAAAGYPTWTRWALLAFVALVLVSIARQVSGAGQVTSVGTFQAMLEYAVPIALAGLGGLWAERTGVVNIGLEGMMIFGTWGGAWGALQFHNAWAGALVGLAFGALGGLLHAIATVTFGVDHIVSGVAINILAPGVVRYLSGAIWAGSEGGGSTQSPFVTHNIGQFTIPGLSTFFRHVAEHNWFLVSDLAGALGGFTSGVSWLTLVTIVLFVGSFVFFWRTRLGLRMRSVGENPVAAESLGVKVYSMKYIGVVVSGALAGLGGAFLSLDASSIYREGQTSGRGFIGLAAVIFGNWRPGGLAAGSGLFGYASALQLRSGVAVHALLLFVAMLLGLFGLRHVLRRRWTSAAVALVAAAVFAAWYAATDALPAEIISFTPHITTLLVLAVAAQRLRPPAWDGLPYRRGEAR